MPTSIVLAISQRYQIKIAIQVFIDRIFKPGLLFSLSTWTRPTFDHSEVKIGLYMSVVLVKTLCESLCSHLNSHQVTKNIRFV